MAESNTTPTCPGCKSVMRNIGGRDRDGLYVSGFGCFDCEGWHVPFKGGIVRPGDSVNDVVFGPLGEMTRYAD